MILIMPLIFLINLGILNYIEKIEDEEAKRH